jgi:hypothetical protein
VIRLWLLKDEISDLRYKVLFISNSEGFLRALEYLCTGENLKWEDIHVGYGRLVVDLQVNLLRKNDEYQEYFFFDLEYLQQRMNDVGCGYEHRIGKNCQIRLWVYY